MKAEEVREVLIDCFFTEVEAKELPLADGVPENAIMVDGPMTPVGFNREKIEKHKETIQEFLKNLDDSFLDGMSFMKLPFTKDGEQWGDHQNAEQLLLLGMAIGELEYTSQKETWPLLPGGMPYIRYTPKDK